jgi:hypothetical protein
MRVANLDSFETLPTTDALLRHANDVDLTKATQSCRRCHGVGITGHLLREGQRVPLICRCVVRNGGVRQDSFAPPSETLALGTADEIVKTALRLPHAMLPACIRSLEKLHAELPEDQKQSARALMLKNARRVLVHRLASITMTADEARVPAQEETP